MLQNWTGLLSLDEYRRSLQMLLSLDDPERYYLILRNTWDYDRGAFTNLYGSALRDQDFTLTHTEFDQYFQSNNWSVLGQVLWAEFHTEMVDDFLMNEDRTSMAHGLEVRVPFLDRDLVSFAFSIPVHLKIKGNRTKYIFRKAMKGLLPEHTISKKWGFSFNPYYQFQKDLKGVAQRVLTKKRVEEQVFFQLCLSKRYLRSSPHPTLRCIIF
jgi:asparagine synthase (glutamine-hydrolysing)